MTTDPKNSSTWRDRLQVLAQMAAIGSFAAALIIASLAIANYRRLPTEVSVSWSP